MKYLKDLKAILYSKRANIYYLDKSRVMVKDGRVVYFIEGKDEYLYWNIPIANTTVILLGQGTSITQPAVRMLASAGVLIGFTGTGGTPLFSGNEIEWLTPQSEYRPTKYVQGWMKFWFDESKRLKAAKLFQMHRINFIKSIWSKDKELIMEGFYTEDEDIKKSLNIFSDKINRALSIGELLRTEAQLTKSLYKIAANRSNVQLFRRTHESTDLANMFLNHGNYLAYGLAASTLWVLGIPHGFAVMHGKTRRGALVFDVADLIKDCLVLPLAFINAKEQASDQDFRENCVEFFTRHKALDFMFKVVKEVSLMGRIK